MSKSVFAADRFVATQHSTAEEKARFCAVFVRFILAGFPRSMFKSAFYRRLSNLFAHIAHYDETGFYETWFATPAKQRQFVRRIREHVPVGDPHYCWSDVERELKSWAAREAEAVEAVLAENERKHAEGMQAEADRRADLVGKTCQQFKVVARSSNTNAFGHRQYIMVANDGSAFKVQRYYGYPWESGQLVVRAACGRRSGLGSRAVRVPGAHARLSPTSGGVT